MLKWALIFFIVSIVAGLLGFSGVAAGAASIAKILFFLFLPGGGDRIVIRRHRREKDIGF